MSDYRAMQYGIHHNGCARPATKGTRIDKQQSRATRKRTPPEVRAIAKAFDCDLTTARAILQSARKANARADS